MRQGSRVTTGSGNPAVVNKSCNAPGVASRSAGLISSSAGSSRRTASQKSSSPGASTTSPHTVMASAPSGASHDHARRSVPAMSSRKKRPNTETMASNEPGGNAQSVDVSHLEMRLRQPGCRR